MGKLFNVMPGPSSGKRLQGRARFSEILSRDTVRFLKINLLTLLCFFPFAAGVILAVLTSSVLILIPASILGGILAGPGLCGMYDCIFRSLRDAPGSAFENYRKAWKQNFRSAILPGILFCVIVGLYLFVLAMFVWAKKSPGAGTYVVYLIGLYVFSIIFTVFWPLLTLFEQKTSDRIRNLILFTARYLWRVLGAAALNMLYWLCLILFLPWSVFLLPLTGFWFILYLTSFLLYPSLNEAFGIEVAIAKAYPDQVPYYETDDEWAERRRKEDAEKRQKSQ